MKKLLLALGVSACGLAAHAQTDEDALRYSQTQLFGTARGAAVGGATGALGSDFTGLSVNPASIALYKRSEFTITPGLSFVNTSSDFLGNTNQSHKYNFNLSNLGLVFTWNRDPKVITSSKWKSFSFGVGANRIANFHNDVFYKGFNSSNSLLNNYVQQIPSGITSANLNEAFPFDVSLAYQTGLIRPYPDSTGYFSPLTIGGLEQSRTATTRGGITDYSLTFGGNYNDKLMLGIGLGIEGLRYLSESTYTERDVNDSIPDFNRFDYTYNLHTFGAGVNGRIGLVYKANDVIRIGASAQTPTYYSLNDQWDSRIHAEYNSAIRDTVSPQGTFKYALVTPWKVTGSVAAIIKKYGFLSVDYEWQDYSSAYFNFNTGSNTADREYQERQNNVIANKYTGAGTLRLGGELALDIFRLRAGYSLGMTPFASGKATSGFDNARSSYSAGFGFLEDNFSLDFGYVHSLVHTYEQPYSVSNGEVPGARFTTKANHFLLTLGYKF